ncbi:hypothetical protein U9M48_020637 [Paspalum notatum var. saurae]|uniref:Uncharacterized protein n=1 Tax=Paspalum notatum var. saurae TaxID=547442 RepID=A0AAQ3TH85_PASNO
MDQDEREVPDQRGDAPAPGGVAAAEGGLERGSTSPEQETAPGMENSGGHGAAGLGSNEEKDLEEALTGERGAPVGNAGHGDAPGSPRNENHEVPDENPAAAYFELRGFPPARPAIAHAMPPSSFRRVPLRDRKQYNPTRFVVVGATGSGGANARDPGASEAATAPPRSAGHGDAPRSARNENHEVPDENPRAPTYFDLRWFRATRRAIAHAMPPSSFRRLMLRDRKQHNLSRFVVANAGVSAAANAGHGDNSEAMGSTAIRSDLEAAVHRSSSDDPKSGGGETNGAAAAEVPSSSSPPSHSRKQRRPDHFVSDSEEAKAASRAKIRRGNIALDRFLTYRGRTHASPEQRPEWVRIVAADDVGAQEQCGDNVLGTASGGGPGWPDGSSTILTIVAILGASLAVCLIACVLFYIVGESGSGPPDTHPQK